MNTYQEQGEDFLSQIPAPLLAWYDANARILPWRESTAPYGVWVSEIMLQQTRVEAVKPYFDRFMIALPTLQALAEAPEEQLLKLWEGLGYYNRVRNLQKAAQQIMNVHGGIFPGTYEELLDLPGVGAYTAGAIASISFGLPVPAVDGNVLRVLARVTENYEDIGSAKVKQEVTAALAEIYPRDRSGDFTQSLMELGAIICTPNGVPKCEVCPLQGLCLAYRGKAQGDLPVKTKKKPRKIEDRTVLLLTCRGKIAICKRQDKGLLGGLWQFPNYEGALTAQEVELLLQSLGIRTKKLTPSIGRKHIFTHIEWHMTAYLVECEGTNPDLSWVSKEELEHTIPLPTAFRIFCKAL